MSVPVALNQELVVTMSEMEQWLCESPSLLSENNDNCLLVPQSTLLGLYDEAKKASDETLENSDEASLLPRRLGHAAESIFNGLISRSSWELITQQHVVYDEKITIGELDFVVEREQQEHWELATKFYLYDSKTRHFIGANGKDRLEDKCQRIFTHQLPMGQHPITRATFPKIECSKLILKGYLYMPFEKVEGDASNDEPLDHGLSFELNPQHGRGWWMTQSNFLEIQKDWSKASFRWLVLRKLEWMSEKISFRDLPEGRDFDEVPKDVRLPHQIALFSNHSERWHETSRGFVVSDDWPKPSC